MSLVRVLLVFSSSELGGAERSLTRMALAPVEGVQYTLATLDGPGPWLDWCRQLGVNPLAFGERSADERHGRISLKALLRLIALVRRERHQVLYVIGLRAAFLLRLFKMLLKGARIVSGIRWNPVSDSRLDRALRLVEFLTGGLVDQYVCNSRAAARTLVERAHVSGNKIRVIYNGLDDLPSAPRPMTRSAPGIVTVANVNPRKGHLQYLDVIQSVVRQRPEARFVFVGRDDMGGRLGAEIERRGLARVVTLTGYQADVGPWLDDAQIMVLPSLWGEGCPTSILEGFAHGLPVVAYAIDGVPELIDDGEDGALVAPGDSTTLANKIVMLIDDIGRARKLGKAGQLKVAQRFTLASCAQAHASVFREMNLHSRAGN